MQNHDQKISFEDLITKTVSVMSCNLSSVDILSRAVQSSAMKRKLNAEPHAAPNNDDILSAAVQASAKKSAKKSSIICDENNSPNSRTQTDEVRKTLFSLDAVERNTGSRLPDTSANSINVADESNKSHAFLGNEESNHHYRSDDDNGDENPLYNHSSSSSSRRVSTESDFDNYRDSVVNPNWEPEKYDLGAVKKCVINSIAQLLQVGTVGELMALHGIGAKRARFIIEERDEGTTFECIDDLQNIGMTPVMINKFIHANLGSILKM